MYNVRRLLSLNAAEQRLFVKAFLLLEGITLGMRLLPFRVLLRLLPSASNGLKKRQNKNHLSAEEIARVVEVASRRMPWPKTCLAQALVTQVFLTRRGYPARLRIGVARGDQGEFQAHAWVESRGKVIIGGGSDLERYAPLGPGRVKP